MGQGICAFPSRLSQTAVPRATVVCVNIEPWLESRGSAGKTGFPGMDCDILGTLGMVARPWSSSRLSCGLRLLLRCDGNARNSLPTTKEMIPPLEQGGRNGALLDVGGTLVLPLEWSGYVGELLELQQGCEGPFGSSRC